MSVGKFFWIIKKTTIRLFNDGFIDLAKSAAYSSILSFFPGLMVVTGLFFSRNVMAAMDEISFALGRVLPPGAYQLAADYLTTQGKRATQGLLAGAWAVAIWSASSVIVTLMEGFRLAYRIPAGRPFLQTRLVAMALIPIALAPMLFATLLLFFSQQFENWLIFHVGEASWLVAEAGLILRWIGALATSTFVILLLYHVAPNRRQKWRYIWPGAVLATGVWLAATLLFAWYVRHIARYSALYGSLSAAVVLLIWMYIINLIVMAGCGFNAEYEQLAIEERLTREHSGM
jgi:membrane protein